MSVFRKLFSRAEKQKDITFYKEKVSKLLSISKLFAIGTRDKIILLYPQLNDAKRMNQWDFFATVLGVWIAYEEIEYCIPGIYKNEFLELLKSDLTQWDPNSFDALLDCEKFVFEHLNSNNNITKYSLPFISGLWLLWNLIDKEEIENEKQIAMTLGNIFHKVFFYYWN